MIFTVKLNVVDLSNIKFGTSFRNKLWNNFMNQASLASLTWLKSFYCSYN